MPNVSPHQSSPFAPSVTFDGQTFWMTWLSDSGDNGIFWATSGDGQNWNSVNRVGGGQAASAPPAIAMKAGLPVIIYPQVPPGSGVPPTILWTQFDPSNGQWTNALPVASGDSASSLTAISKGSGVLILFREATTSTLDSTTI